MSEHPRFEDICLNEEVGFKIPTTIHATLYSAVRYYEGTVRWSSSVGAEFWTPWVARGVCLA